MNSQMAQVLQLVVAILIDNFEPSLDLFSPGVLLLHIQNRMLS